MGYTEQRENSLYTSWDADVGDDDYSVVLNMLNTEFRAFGLGLQDIMEKKAGHKIELPINYLKEKCEQAGVPLSAVGSLNTMRSWFSGGPRPKKSEGSRKSMFAFSFALELSTAETAMLFHKVFLDRAFNYRNYKELIYYYCLERHLPFNLAESLISQVHLEDCHAEDKTVYTQMIASEAAQSASENDLLSYIHSHAHNFLINNASAKQALITQKKKALKLITAEQLYTKEDSYGMDTESDSFLYSIVMERSVTGKHGTITVPFKDATLPKEIKNNFPQAKSLSEKDDTYEELRKTIILLFSFCFWQQAENEKVIDFFDDYTSQLNTLLEDAGFSPLYYGNPYDWMFLYCASAEYPLDAFHGILSAALDDTE